ncbi:hypothetical protein FPV67DRAFT_1779081 [Lyophyllum atratum]|nr:hypothetical protein FPV67DRAFT_1779081 [Lyophyllum atratum]
MTNRKTQNGASPKKPRSKLPAAAVPPAPPTMEALVQAQAANRAKFARPKKTADAYKGHLARGRTFLKELVSEKRKTGNNDVGSGDINIDLLEKAFDNPPNRFSAHALELFLIQKCVVENLKTCTAHGIQAAFADLWDNMDGDSYAGDYMYDKKTDTVHGCPARSATIKNLIKTFTLKATAEGAPATREHAEAMKIEDLNRIMVWSESQFSSHKNTGGATPGTRRLKAKHLMSHDEGFYVIRIYLMDKVLVLSLFQAFSCGEKPLDIPLTRSAYRNFELCKLRMRHLKRDCTGGAPHYSPYLEVFLDQRKGWQSKAGSETSLESNHYNIYKQDVPAMDMYTHLLVWLHAYEEFLGRPLLPDEFVFPFISPNGTINPDREMSHDVIQKLISEFATGAGLLDIFTTHSFRRGGAQYRFIFAPFGKRWSLNIIRWWGGWAAGENVDTLMKYLIDSLNSREKSHMDMLNPAGPSNVDKSFNGEYVPFPAPCALPSAQETGVAHGNVPTRLSPACACANQPMRTSLPDTSVFASRSSPPSSTVRAFMSLPSTATVTTCAASAPRTHPTSVAMGAGLTASATTSLLPTSSSSGYNPYPPPEISPPLSTILVPNLGRRKGAWRRALDQWYNPDEKTKIAMKDWHREWYQGDDNKGLANLRSGRQTIAEEFEACGGTHAHFLDTYPLADEQSFTRVLDRIRASHGRRRKSKNGPPEARAHRNQTI